MADEPASQTTEAPRCQWCSAELPAEGLASCPSCGATLNGDADPTLPGITALDAEAIIRARAPAPQRRNRLLSWISGEYQDNEETPAPPGSLELPSEDVRREMLRLELEAEVAELQAEAESIVAEAEIEAREEGWTPTGEAPRADAAEQDAVAAPGSETAADEATPAVADDAAADLAATDEDSAAAEAAEAAEDRPSA